MQKYQDRYHHLLDAVRQLKSDFGDLAGMSSAREREAFRDAAEMVQNMLDIHRDSGVS